MGKIIYAKGFKKLPKAKKSPNLVTLVGTYNISDVCSGLLGETNDSTESKEYRSDKNCKPTPLQSIPKRQTVANDFNKRGRKQTQRVR